MVDLHQEQGICVVKRQGENLIDLIKRFKKKYAKSGILLDLKRNMFYEKPSIQKKRKRAAAERRRKKEEEKKSKRFQKGVEINNEKFNGSKRQNHRKTTTTR